MRALLPALLFLLPSAAYSSGVFFSGNELYNECNKSDKNIATGYVMGIADLEAHYNSNSVENYTFCLPPEVLSTQLRDVACRYLENNPQTRHATAASIVKFAAKEAWPCTP